jgi:hypothetical protein
MDLNREKRASRVPYMVAMVFTKAASTYETPEPT